MSTTINDLTGRDLDAWLAEHILGWRGPVTWVDDEAGRDPYLFDPQTPEQYVAANDQDHNHLVPYFCTDLAAAWQIARHFIEEDWRIVLDGRRDGSAGIGEAWECQMEKGRVFFSAHATSPAEAICVAAYQATH